MDDLNFSQLEAFDEDIFEKFPVRSYLVPLSLSLTLTYSLFRLHSVKIAWTHLPDTLCLYKHQHPVSLRVSKTPVEDSVATPSSAASKPFSPTRQQTQTHWPMSIR